MAYTTFLLVPVKMIRCVLVDGDTVWFFDGSVDCLSGWQFGAVAAISVLLPFPLLLIIVMLRWRLAVSTFTEEDGSDRRSWRILIRSVLMMGMKEETRWWLGVSLVFISFPPTPPPRTISDKQYRRATLVLASTMIYDLNWKALAVTALCCVFLAISFIVRPWQHKVFASIIGFGEKNTHCGSGCASRRVDNFADSLPPFWLFPLGNPFSLTLKQHCRHRNYLKFSLEQVCPFFLKKSF